MDNFKEWLQDKWQDLQWWFEDLPHKKKVIVVVVAVIIAIGIFGG